MGVLVTALVVFVVPGETEPLDKHGRVDYIGCYLGVGGLILFNFVWKLVSIYHPCPRPIPSSQVDTQIQSSPIRWLAGAV